MPVTGIVGLPGTGKTLRAVQLALEALDGGREVYANFRIGSKVEGFLVPRCSGPELCECWVPWRSVPARHAVASSRFVPLAQLVPAQVAVYREMGLRRGRAFVADRRVTVLDSWEQVIAIRQARDVFDSPHRLQLTLGASRTAEGDAIWSAEPSCLHHVCAGCSRGITVVLDELNLWAPSRFWSKLGVGVLNRWAYVRKDGLEIVWTAQHEARIDKVAREVTDFIWTCQSFGGTFDGGLMPAFHLQLFQRRKWIPALMTDANRVSVGEGATRSGGGAPVVGGMLSTERACWIGPWGSMRKVAARYGTYDHVSVEPGLVGLAGAGVARKPARGGARSGSGAR